MNDYKSSNPPSWIDYSNSVKTIRIEEGITSIGSYAFSGFEKLSSIAIAESVNMIGSNAFSYCEMLYSIVIPDGVTEIQANTFYKCTSLWDVVIPDTVVSIGASAFYNTDIRWDAIPESVTSFGMSAFSNCGELTSAVIPEGVTSIPSKMFSGCTDLTSVVIPETVISIGTHAFDGCTSLMSITIPEVLSELGDYAFRSCSSLTSSIVIPEGVTKIGKETFLGCSSLPSIVISKGVLKIDEKAFSGCKSLSEITFLGDKPSMEYDAFVSVKATVYYPKGNTTYKNIVNFPYFKNAELTWVENELIPAPTPTPTPTLTPVPSSGNVERIKGTDRFATSLEVADALKEELGVDKFDAVILVNGRDFADALAGSCLAAEKNAPILMVDNKSTDRMEAIVDYIEKNMKSEPEGVAYILGGEAAVPELIEDLFIGRSISYTRLKGKNRYGTNIAILNEVGVSSEEILVANAKNFADSLSASATGKPLLLVGSSLNADQKAFLAAHPNCTFTILGGTGAVSADVEEQLSAYGSVRRLSGTNRYATSVKIAETYFNNADSIVLAYARNFPDGLAGGPLAYAMGAPLILVDTDKNPAHDDFAVTYATDRNIKNGYVLGGAGLVKDDTVKDILGKVPTLK